MARSGILTPPIGKEDQVPFSRPPTPHVKEPKIGFVGLGNLGMVMAKNLANFRASHLHGSSPVWLWNRSTSKTESLAKELGDNKVAVASSLEQIVNECEIIITNLANDAVVEEVYSQFDKILSASGSSHRKLFVETSTIYPILAGKLDGLISAHQHAHLICAPVFGTPKAAATSQLLIVMSGDYYLGKKQIAYLFVPAIGRKVIDMGGNIEKAPTFKLIGNSMILGVLEALSESFTLADKVGIDSETVLSFVKEVLPAPGTITYAERFAHDRFDATDGFNIEGGVKDASLIRRLTSEYNAPMPTIDIAHQHLISARAINGARAREGKSHIANLDWSGLIAASRAAAALDPFDSSKHTNLVVEEES